MFTFLPLDFLKRNLTVFCFLAACLTSQTAVGQTCPESVRPTCTATFIAINGEFGDVSGTNVCPPEITITGESGSTATIMRSGACQSEEDSYVLFGSHSFNCGSNTLAISFNGLTCNYDTPGGLINQEAALPVELVDLKVKKGEDYLQLQWRTALEINNDFFTIERSSDGRNFERIETVAGAGNSSRELLYIFTDKEPKDGYNFYRLSQTDFDGKTEMYEIVLAEYRTGGQISVAPNPVSGITVIRVSENLTKQASEITLYNMASGQPVYFAQTRIESGEVQLDMTDLPRGMYSLTVKTNNKVFNERIVKN